MPLYRREGSPFWWYSFTVNGLRFRGSTGEAGKRQAAIVEHDARLKAKNRRTYDDAWRLREAIGAYWTERGQHLRGASTVFHKLDRMSELLGPDTLIADITNSMVLEYRAKRRGEGLQPHSVNRDIAALQAVLNNAAKVHGKQVPVLAWAQIKVAEPPNRLRFLSEEEYKRLLSVAHADLRPLIAFAVATGLRKANVLNLDWQQVNMGARRIEVLVKGNKRGQIKMADSVRALLSAQGGREGPVFDTTNFRRRWAQAIKDAKLENFRFHDLRHTFASWARQEGADIADICEALLHSDISVTMKYAHIRADEHVTAFDRISKKLRSQSRSQSTKTAMKTGGEPRKVVEREQD